MCSKCQPYSSSQQLKFCATKFEQSQSLQRPEGERPVVEGSAALRFLDALFGRTGAASSGGLFAFRGSFFLIYELFTGTLEVKLLPEDIPPHNCSQQTSAVQQIQIS